MKEIQKMRNSFKEMVDILDEIIDLVYRAENGEQGLEEQIKSKYGYMYYKMLEISTQNK